MFFDITRSLHPRVMMYSQDGLGLGHMRRTTSIAHQLLRANPDACVLTMADSRLGQFFETAPNHDYLKLPSILKAGPGDWRAVNLPLPFAHVHAMRKELIRSAVLSFRPHVLLVDHMPHGAMGELLPSLEALRQSGADTQVVLGLRDILDAPEVVRRRWEVEGAYEAVERYYDRVLVYGRREVFNLAEQYGFSAEVAQRMRYTGYVCTAAAPQHASRLRARYLAGSAPGTKLVLAMAGGGADAYPMMRAVLDALPAVAAAERVALVLVAGPFMPAQQRKDLEARARGLPARVLTSTNDTISLIEAADLVVAMAGYNTSTELLRSGKPVVLVRRVGPSAEQRMRARLFAERGWMRMIDPDEITPVLTARTLLDSLRGAFDVPRLDTPDTNGVAAAADQLLALIPSPGITIPAPALARVAA
jgi:predicted glycosyltransferase